MMILRRLRRNYEFLKYLKDDNIYDDKSLRYRPKTPRTFVDGKYTIFKCTENRYFDVQLQQAHITVPFWLSTITLITNPFYMTFPAILPLLGSINIILVIMYTLKRQQINAKIGEIILYENGHMVQLVYFHKGIRQFRGKNTSQFAFIPDLHQVERKPNDRVVFHEYPQFPRRGFTYKFLKNRQHYVTLPSKHWQDQELLPKVLNGLMIDNAKT